MKIAITADTHLQNRNKTPKRYKTIENIFEKCLFMDVKFILFLGDTFDSGLSYYHDFDDLCKKFKEIQVIIIPGNHDFGIQQRFFTSDNIEIIDKPTVKDFDGALFFFVPYDTKKTLDETLAEISSENEYVSMFESNWFLAGHGDYITGNRQFNPYEPGIYMPISSKSINRFSPSKVFLGHIHKPCEFGKVTYPGSPYPLDISETGKRSFIVLDVNSGKLERVDTETDIIYFVESLLVLPLDDEIGLLRKRIKKMIEDWGLTENELKNVKLRLKLKGYTKDRKTIFKAIDDSLKELKISYYDSNGPDMSELMICSESEKISILQKLKEKLDSINLEGFFSSKEDILEKAADLIFKE